MNRKYFPPAPALFSLALVLSCLTPGWLRAAETVPLAGEWRFALDRNDVGTNEQWFAKKLPDKIQLPGVLEAVRCEGDGVTCGRVSDSLTRRGR